MTPSHSRKQGLRYGYYVSSALIQGQPELAGSVTRVPAAAVESLISAAVAHHFATEPPGDLRELVRTHVARVDITATTVRVTLNPPAGHAPDQSGNMAAPQGQGGRDDSDLGSANNDHQPDADPVVLSIPWTKRLTKRYREILIPNGASRSEIRQLRPETRARLLSAIARGRLWLAEMQSGAVANVQDIAARENCSKRHVHMTISLAFLAPSLVKAAVEGRLPHGIGVARMFDLPPGWARQYQILGLAPPPSLETRCPG
jgi:site-specific DNA recombinase